VAKIYSIDSVFPATDSGAFLHPDPVIIGDGVIENIVT
jgi:hypothetical protein